MVSNSRCVVEELCTVGNQRRLSPTNLWAYAYRIVPPQPKRRLDMIRELLDFESVTARKEARTWASRIVLERRATRILIVSDSPPERGVGVDLRLATELQRLQVTYTRTDSMEISQSER